MLERIDAFRRRARAQWLEGHNRRTALIIMLVLLPIVALYLAFIHPPVDFPVDDIITVEDGASLSSVATSFSERHVVRSALALRAAVTIMGGERSVIAGDYQFHRPRSVFAIARLITTGTFGLEPERIYIPEGSMTTEMAKIYARHLPRFDQETFLKLAQPLEGYLYPDTYFFFPNATEEQVVKTMLSNFELQVKDLREAIASSEHSFEEIIVMASLLEKEAHRYADRQRIAGVLWRRIDIGMALQVDAAFLYFLGRTTYDLTLEDLQIDSPYNTYKYKGLPPGPITNPSVSSIRAALDPIDTGALFYLADRHGNTYYSKTYEEHLQKKRIYID